MQVSRWAPLSLKVTLGGVARCRSALVESHPGWGRGSAVVRHSALVPLRSRSAPLSLKVTPGGVAAPLSLKVTLGGVALRSAVLAVLAHFTPH
jgi:hypothetical protein